MHVVIVHINVKTEYIKSFIEATKENAENSRNEAGVLRFEVYQQSDIKEKFILLEIYRSAEDQVIHRETIHYKKWRDAVAGMMSEPRKGINYNCLFSEQI